jgi:hypothetical protein
MALDNLNNSYTWNSRSVAPHFNPSTTSPVADTSLAPTTANSTEAEPNKPISNGSLALALSALTLGIVGVGGFLLHRHLNAKQTLDSTAQATREVASQVKENTTKSIPNVTNVMVTGNEGMSCHTMATLNALRYYQKHDENLSPEVRKRINAILQGSPEEARVRTQAFLKTILPDEYGRYLMANGNVQEAGKSPLMHMIPSLISQYVFGHPSQTFSTFHANNLQDFGTVLEELQEGKVGVFGGNQWGGGHWGTLHGISEQTQGLIDEVLEDIRNGRIPRDEAQKKIHFLVHDQLNVQNPLTQVSLYDVMDAVRKEDEFYLIHLPGQIRNLKQPRESEYIQAGIFSEHIGVHPFQAKMNRIGDRIFGVR